MSWTREPLVWFVGLGVLVVGIQVLRDGGLPADPEAETTIVVDDGLVADLSRDLQTSLGRAPSDTEVTLAVERWIDTEILVREARRLGLDQTDPQVRARLAQKMATVQQASAVPPEPTDAELRTLYDAHADDFAGVDRVTFRHLWADSDAKAQALHQAWTGGADPRTLTETYAPGGPVLRGRTEANLTERYGATFAAAVMALPTGTPTVVAATDGFHVVSVTDHIAATAVSFDQARDRLIVRHKQAWLREATDRALDDLRDTYEVDGWP